MPNTPEFPPIRISDFDYQRQLTTKLNTTTFGQLEVGAKFKMYFGSTLATFQKTSPTEGTTKKLNSAGYLTVPMRPGWEVELLNQQG